MATQGNDSVPQTKYSPEVVANAFVSQYYNIFHQSPEEVHKFYQDTSSMTRPGPDGLITVSTLACIKDLVASLACREYRTQIITADAQASYKGGVIVLVTGCLIGKDDFRLRFTELFFLAPQENGYYVHNDVFRFIDEDKAAEVNNLSNLVHSSSNSREPEPETAEGCEKSSSQIPAEAAEAVSIANQKVDDGPSVEISTVKESVSVAELRAEVVPNQKDDQPVGDTVSDVSEDTPKKSYASILKVQTESKDDTAHAVSKYLKSSPLTNETKLHAGKSPGSNGVLRAPPCTGQLSAGHESASSNGNCGIGNNVTDEVEGKGYSIYIGNLPYNPSVSLVEQEFKQFGPIKRGSVQIRCNKGFWFGFVEYESLESMQKAVQTSVLHIRGYEAFIQKKTSTRGGNGTDSFSSGGGGGRGGGQRNNDRFRGQGNFSGGVVGRRGGYNGRNNGYGSGNGGGYSGRNNERGEDYFHANGPRHRTDGSRGGGRGSGYQNGGKAFRQVSGGR